MIKSIIRTSFIFVISYAILIAYNSLYVDNYINYSNHQLLINLPVIFYIYVMSVISFYFYNSDKIYLKNKKTNTSVKFFSFVSEFIHISSVIICFNAVIVNDFIYLELHNSLDVRYMGVAISSIAIALFISSKITLGKNYSPCYDQRIPNKIITGGIYKFVRHPIYSSNILLLFGIFIISGSFLIIGNLLLLIFFYTISAFKEEKYLINKFPNYSSYSKKTGMFIPKYWK